MLYQRGKCPVWSSREIANSAPNERRTDRQPGLRPNRNPLVPMEEGSHGTSKNMEQSRRFLGNLTLSNSRSRDRMPSLLRRIGRLATECQSRIGARVSRCPETNFGARRSETRDRVEQSKGLGGMVQSEYRWKLVQWG